MNELLRRRMMLQQQGDSVDWKGLYAALVDRSISEIVIPAGMTEIGVHAFNSCLALTSIVIPEGVEVLNMYCFANCQNALTAELPSTITTIKNLAFYDCSHMLTMVIRAVIPPTLQSTNVFMYCHANFYVPDASVDAYKAASMWSN